MHKMRLRHFFLPCLIGWLTTALATDSVRADGLDDCVGREMEARVVSGVSVAIIRDRHVVSARVWGKTETSGTNAITPETLFQAGSVSKALTALGALLLVEQGKLSLDEDVNMRLKEWKVPENEFTRKEKVTVRRILSHTAGFSVHGFSGYSRGKPVPKLTDILDGTAAANTGPIRVGFVPGSQWKYSGGGYIVLQMLMMDVTGEPFPVLMKELVLDPLQMKQSTFEQPLPAVRERSAAAGHFSWGGRVPGQWDVYPEMAAAGLWTTPSDLAHFAIAIQEAKGGRKGGAISPRIAQWMTTPVMNKDGLGLFMSGRNNEIFGHDGRNLGFDSDLRASATDGVVVMVNGNDDGGGVNRICKEAWAGLRPPWPVPIRKLDPRVDSKMYPDYAGRYDYGGAILEVMVENGRLFVQLTGQEKFEVFPSGKDGFFLKAVEASLVFERDGTGTVTGVTHTQGDMTFTAPKMKP